MEEMKNDSIRLFKENGDEQVYQFCSKFDSEPNIFPFDEVKEESHNESLESIRNDYSVENPFDVSMCLN
jgi:uncharacterized protein YrzB (UPF0473 family)